ncbi:hypothetical protein GCM10011403_18040 [Pseudohongiella nitratireducens]|uniref:Peptidase C39-like domain-containing protein n=1 Tax=Pseudohongiella nitratireducens TaxID=1768907 RepID=A0A916VJH8_9GAMM|nr:PA2778 family cysteine peptidase [Pseudohongiella nitratireducens]GFZ75829.1 hypothetical protein GCM10011403_18040 [Pseudohongiella nitratireducens]
MRFNWSARQRALLLLLFALLQACVATPQTDALLQGDDGTPVVQPRIYLSSTVFYPQSQYQCGPAALATVLTESGVLVEPDELVSQVYLPERQGSLQVEMLATSRRYGRIALPLGGQLTDLMQELEQGRPVLVMQNLGLKSLPQWHYAVAVGYDLANEEILLRSGTVETLRTPMTVFERTWARADHWSVVLLEPGTLPVNSTAQQYFTALASFEQINEDTSEPAWKAGLERWPESELLAMGYSNLLYRKGRLAVAAEILELLLQRNPDYQPARNNLQQIRQQLDEPTAN